MDMLSAFTANERPAESPGGSKFSVRYRCDHSNRDEIPEEELTENGTRGETGQSVGKDVNGYKTNRCIERDARAMGDGGDGEDRL